MTGEMSELDVTEDAWPLHFAIARALKGKVRPFDTYQGPFVQTQHGRLWIGPDENGDRFSVVYNERTRKASAPFWPYGKLANRRACKAARDVTIRAARVTESA